MKKKKNWFHVNIPLTQKVTIDRLFELENNLSKKGISFDTGTDFSSRDWELDWSLHGALPEDIFKILDSEGIKYTKIQRK